MSPNSDSHDSEQRSESGGNLKIIDLEFETLRQFREVMAPRLCYEGFFVATKDPLPKGTPARFRFLLPDGFILVEGTAIVAWARFEDERPDAPAGMALLFNQLEPQSREIVDELIDFHIATGGDPFEIGPAASEPGDIGTDALAGDLMGVPSAPPEPELETVPDAIDSTDKKSEDFLPDWLSEVAQKHEVDLGADETIPVGETPEGTEPSKPAEILVPEEISEAPEPTQGEFEISLMPEEEEPYATPIQAEAEPAAEVTMPPRETRQPPRDLRLWPFFAAAVVIVAASAIVWWIVNRGPVEAPLQPAVVAEEIPASEPQPSIVEEPAAEESAEPPEVPEAVPESMPEIEEVTGPATRVLLVAAARVDDATVVSVRANGEMSEDSVRVSRLKDPARVWVRIQGIETFYRPNDIEVGTPEVERVRVGHHPEETPQSLYVVFDLSSAAAVVREWTVEGDTLRVVVGR
jgi:hypothetical protein